MKKEPNLRTLIENFYGIISSENTYQYLYKQHLSNILDKEDIEPLPFLCANEPYQQAQISPLLKTAPPINLQWQYRSRDFCTILMYGYLIKLLQENQLDQIHLFHNKLLDQIALLYDQEQESRFRESEQMKIDYFFQGMEYLATKKYDCQYRSLFKIFFKHMFESKHSTILQRQPYYQSYAGFLCRLLLGQPYKSLTKKQIHTPPEYPSKLQCSLLIVKEKKKQKYGEYPLTVRIQQINHEYYILQGQELSMNPSSQQITNLLLDLKNITTMHEENTKQLEIIYNLSEKGQDFKSVGVPNRKKKSDIL